MNELPEREPESVEDAFAAFLEQRETDPARSFEDWVEGRPDSVDLCALHGAFEAVRRHLPEPLATDASGPVTRSLEAGFEILEPLGRGGYGEVLRARDRALQREVALKVLGREARVSPEMRQRFLEEARVLARLDHPNIVRIHAIDSEDGEIRLQLELIEGRTLQQIVDDEGPFAPEETARIGIELCHALAAIHAEDLVHMDLKPGNVMRAAGGRIVLLDFGFARSSSARAGREGSPVGGTPPFMSPEHFEGRADIGPRADVYSLGVLLYWLVSGSYPYDYQDFDDLSARVLAGDATPLLDVRPDAPAGLAEILERAMARDEAQRFASAGEMEAALRRFLRGQEPVTPAADTGRRRLLLAAGAMVLVVLGVWIAGTRGAPGAFAFEAAFHRGAAAGDGLSLADGDSVRVGDELHLRARSDTAFYLYAFNQDERGNWYRLLPRNDAAELHEAGVWHRFPGKSWIVDSAGETEHLYVLASPHRIPFADELVAVIPPAGRNQGQLTRGEVQRLRGIGTEAPGTESPDGPFDLEEHFTRFAAGLAKDDPVHAAHYRLKNEGR